MATQKASNYIDRVYAKIVEKNTADVELLFQTQITALEKQLTALKAKAKATIESSSNQDMITALNKLVDMGAIDETERDAAYKKFGIKSAPKKSAPAVDNPCGGTTRYVARC